MTSNGWRETTLGHEIDLLTGFPFKSSGYTSDPKAPRLLRGDNVVQGQLRWDDAKRWPADELFGLDEYFLQPGDVVLAMDRPWIEAGLKYAVIREQDLPVLLVQRVARLRAKAGLDQTFLRYVVGSREFTEYVLSVQTGTTVPHISGTQIRSYPFKCPPLPEQRTIAHILGTLDDKIELNRRMNETLEAMARALFKAWFVDFDPVRAKAAGRNTGLPPHIAELFPDSFEDSELGEVPRGWKVKPIADLADVVGGSTPSTKVEKYWHGGVHCWATPKDLSSLSVPILLDTERRITDEGLAQIGSGLLPPGTVLLSSRAPIGYLAVTQIPVAINQGFIAMKPKADMSSYYLLLWAGAARDTIISRANGSTFLEISKANFRPIPVVVPTATVLTAFENHVRMFYDRMRANCLESRTLAALRDTLLPRLISGQLRVKDAERLVADYA